MKKLAFLFILIGLLTIGSGYDRLSENNKLLSPLNNYILYETTSFMLLYTFFSYVGMGFSSYSYGGFSDAISYQPLDIWWPWVFPLAVLIISLVLLRISTKEPIYTDEILIEEND